MGWRARWGHVTQLYRHAGDAPGVVEGANDCFEAALARYLRETGYAFAGSSDADLIASLRLRITGQPDQAGQGFTWLTQGSRGLAELGIAYRWTSTLLDALRQPWSILWVRAIRLRLDRPVMVEGVPQWTAYPLSWLRDEGPDHFILKLPDGSCNDPLAYYCADCTYSRTSLSGAFAGAYVLQSPATAPVLPAPQGPIATRRGDGLVVTAAQGLHLREAPVMESPVLATLDSGEHLTDEYDTACLWRFVRARGLNGWVRREWVGEA